MCTARRPTYFLSGLCLKSSTAFWMKLGLQVVLYGSYSLGQVFYYLGRKSVGRQRRLTGSYIARCVHMEVFVILSTW